MSERIDTPHSVLPERVQFVDCTLRDGEQTPGVWFTLPEKLELASLLDSAGVDVLDAGFPGSSAEEIEILQELRMRGLRASIGATARAVPEDVVAAERARAQEVFLFLPTSDLRLIGLRMSRKDAALRLRRSAEDVVGRGMALNIVAEDAYRSDVAWLIELWVSLRDVPMKRFVICDTVGAALPNGMADLVTALRARIDPGTAICTHCHNDFGLATANTLAAVAAGAPVVSTTVNGIGERAGNADLAEVAAALTHLLGVEHGIVPEKLPALAMAVDRLTGVHASPLKPVTGSNVYSHESGVHVDGMLKDPRSYEFLPAAWTHRSSKMVLGKHSGAALLRRLLEEEGLDTGESSLRSLLAEVKSGTLRRDKTEHHRMHAKVLEFRTRALGGMAKEDLIARARRRASERT
jgi:isopropylmalate/homocitrate/citramalate synthase